MKDNIGYLTGETCNRNGCKGTIDEYETDTHCSCHIHPPCSHCVDDRHFCPICGWEGINEQKVTQNINIEPYQQLIEKQGKHRESVLKKMSGELPITELDYITEGHTHFSMKLKGVYPAEMSRQELLGKIKGTFGGRFVRYGNGVFEYIAYTD